MGKCKGTISNKDFERFFNSIRCDGEHSSYPSKEWLVLRFREWGLSVEGYKVTTRKMVIEIAEKVKANG